ncbi:DNA repair protein RecN [Marinilactibacillus psychrotolerans]|uniref:DNA repair protein RecN n=2 Tax=Marinilactibacillus psychrotolerans TaxID=191770 RepID=A0A511H3Q7_9LACT|nr:DNA repair protein RecN [Marinilactibacillus psychrotolerans]TLQ09236.1 DNA repair protein RecN [Marinilactibacillus psychrotolerans]SDD11636.1 DNA repair protein RecN (Recombination protein N) [Marinilactibacillus psychrotolerans]SJN18504.1 DNA repair protein RecN [Marinilactibacillus psychrotolerans 42ea]GEL68157.1 DNA repair protein RecN [Marinilactibacillus psychrotolerans]GEQ32130.1 DNA repair protein RecN [Marinilactibacillus psychrotolerans]
MLQALHIQNFAIIQDLSLDFSHGMTVLTGETGAGKSIIIDAVGLLAGGRGSTEFVRYGTKKCLLEGHFSLNENQEVMKLLDEHAIDSDDEVIMIQREIFATGRNVCRINGTIVTIAVLKEIGTALIDIHGQNEHQELMVPESHIELLDQYGDKKLANAKKRYKELYKEYKAVKKEQNEWQYNEQELAQRLDILKFQVDEIGEAQLEDHEEETLKEEEQKLSNHQSIVEALSSSYNALQGEENSGLDLVGQAMDSMASIEGMDEKFKQISDTVSAAFFQIQEASSDIYNEMDNLEYDEERLNEIETRLNLIQQLKRKYGQSIQEIKDFYSKALAELEKIDNREGQMDHLNKRVKELETKLVKEAYGLSKYRREVAKRLEKAIHEQLKELFMDKVVFSVHFSKEMKEFKTNAAYENGMDKVEFYVATNPGEPLKPLVKVASGGELSRMMLAMKTIFSKEQGMTSIIFDEVDTGVSGRVAQAIADKIYSVAQYSQVLCITHLPQVAAMADQHLYISKVIIDERTSTHVEQLPEDDKIQEVARMLAGSEITKLTIDTAKELLALASNKKIKNY